MSSNKYIYAVLAALFCSACALPVRKPPPPVEPVKKETVIKVSPEDMLKVESLYYKAVGAYSANDMDSALNFLNEISTMAPSYQPAGELRGKIKSVPGANRAAVLPGKP